jgi:NAD(P)-dependent dehydrogenase (short-subunit alcohol dehydrogenase family)
MANTAPGRLAGKRAIVTGAGSGSGRPSAQLFAAEGARVQAADNNAAAVARTVAAITAAGGIALAAEADAAAEDDVKDLVERALGTWSWLDIFYANAGISGGRVPSSSSRSSWAST